MKKKEDLLTEINNLKNVISDMQDIIDDKDSIIEDLEQSLEITKKEYDDYKDNIQENYRLVPLYTDDGIY